MTMHFADGEWWLDMTEEPQESKAPMSEQQARECIIAWAKEHFAGKTSPDVSVVGIHYDAEFDVWDTQLSVSSSTAHPYIPCDPYVTFREDAECRHGIYVSQVEY